MSIDGYFLRDDYSAIMDAKRRDLLRLLAAAQATAIELQQDLESDPSFRNQAVQASRKLTQTLQTPVDRAWELLFHSTAPSVLIVSINAGWLSLINDSKGSDRYNQGVTIDEIAGSNSSDFALVQRMMRVLTSEGLIRETQNHQYAPTPISKLFDNIGWADGLRHSLRDFSIATTSMPEYFEKNRYQQPDKDHGIYEAMYGTPFFERIKQDEKVGKQFANFMEAMRIGEKPWYEIYPVADKMHVESASDVLLVDIGGSKGHDLLAFAQFRKELGGLPGKLVLQDQPSVISHVPSSTHDIEIQAYDFFEPQPVIGARVYFLKHVLHDWVDKDCVSILSLVRDAMKVGYSKLLINEGMVPDRECSPRVAGFDILMMALVGGTERTTSEWKALIAAVDGLEVEAIWTFGHNNDGVIEVIRKA